MSEASQRPPHHLNVHTVPASSNARWITQAIDCSRSLPGCPSLHPCPQNAIPEVPDSRDPKVSPCDFSRRERAASAGAHARPLPAPLPVLAPHNSQRHV